MKALPHYNTNRTISRAEKTEPVFKQNIQMTSKRSDIFNKDFQAERAYQDLAPHAKSTQDVRSKSMKKVIGSFFVKSAPKNQ